MAKICVLCGSLCAYFLLFLEISSVLSINDYYSYGVTSSQHRSENFIDLDVLYSQKEHGRHKRDVHDNRSNTSQQPNSTVPPKPTFTTVVKSTDGLDDHRTDYGISSDNGTLSDLKVTATKSKPGKPPKATSVTVQPLQKNLGENGAGQRKNITVQKPILLNNGTSPSEPLLRNKIPLNLNITATSVDDEALPLPADEDTGLFNHTLSEHNITESRNDTHIYYNSSLTPNPELANFYWVNLTNHSDAKVNDLLSQSHRRAATVKLSFEFPFYGHLIKNVTIATGGFLYTGDYVHSWLAATQYIAPLMANFDTSLSNDSLIHYADNGTSFTVEWQKVSLQDKPNEGQFTFQTTLFNNGDIVFVYKNVPLFIKQIEDEHHPVKVGLSDAYIIDRTIFFVRRKTIYEYHRVNFQKESITNGTVIYLEALPTCLGNKDCVTCLTNKQPSFDCRWCPSANRCSTGLDRHRQEWLIKNCDKKQVDGADMCSHVSGDDVFDRNNTTYAHDEHEFRQKMEDFSKSTNKISPYSNPSALGPNQPVKMGVSGIVAILFLITMVSGLAVWVLYAYRNPHTTSGQILIRYRPSQWRWRRGEARYTAATIHM